MKPYTQLSMAERKRLYQLKQHIKSVSKIAQIMNRDRSTIYRELKRNLKSPFHLYLPITVNGIAKARRRNRKRTSKVQASHLEWIVAKLKLQWSPDQVCKRMSIELGFTISHEWIYNYIYKDRLAGGVLYKNLRRGHRKRKKRIYVSRESVRFKGAKSIEKRPKIVEKRKRLGDFEGDLIIGSKHKQALVTLVDRVSLFTKIQQVENKTAQLVRQSMIQMMNKIEGRKYTLTLDNGSEFADHKIISKTCKIDVYFAHPYSSYERGTNENQNGLVRQYFPKGTDLRSVSLVSVQNVEDLLNHRPRKKLGYRTPFEVHNGIELITENIKLEAA